jgi:predicted NAD/FAD-dependent oxidoreductase
VVLAIPAPQASALLGEEHGAAFPALAQARYDPCWALMVAHANKSPACADVIRNEAQDAVLRWIACDTSKPGRTARDTCWVAHASTGWSTTHLERDPDQVLPPLLDAFGAATGLDPAEARYTAAHRWRYARVAVTAGRPFLWDNTLKLGLCGDWCQGARVEAAFDSGAELAEAMVAALPMPCASRIPTP